MTADRLAALVPGRQPADPAPAPGLVVRLSTLAGCVARRGDVQAVAVLLLTGLAIRFSVQRHQGIDAWLAVALALVSTAPLLLLRVLPVLALALPVLSGALFITTARLEWPSASITCWLAALALCPLYLRRAHAVAGLAVAEASVAAALFVPDRINATPWDATVAELLAAAIAWWLGETVRTRRDTRAERAAVTRRLRTLAERDAVARERARIARELHDVVAHHVSTIAVRAATLPYEVGDLPEPARAGLAEIAEGPAPHWPICAPSSACCAPARTRPTARRNPGSRTCPRSLHASRARVRACCSRPTERSGRCPTACRSADTGSCRRR